MTEKFESSAETPVVPSSRFTMMTDGVCLQVDGPTFLAWAQSCRSWVGVRGDTEAQLINLLVDGLETLLAGAAPVVAPAPLQQQAGAVLLIELLRYTSHTDECPFHVARPICRCGLQEARQALMDVLCPSDVVAPAPQPEETEDQTSRVDGSAVAPSAGSTAKTS